MQTTAIRELAPDMLIDMYRQMVLIRCFEEALKDLYARGEMPGLAHVYIGEEAVAVGICSALRRDDYITSTHRGHGHVIAKGGDIRRMMAEVMGKRDGYCRGKGGEMHIADFEIGMLGANGIVGGGLSLASGAALAAKVRGTDQVAVCFFGDGGANQGVFHETMNMAAVWKLPVVFVCENNYVMEYTDTRRVSANLDIAGRGRPYGLPSDSVDGMDVLAVYAAAREAVERARSGEGPSLIEAKTYRFEGHHQGDVRQAVYKDAAEEARWKARDPVKLFTQELLSAGVLDQARLRALEAEVQLAVADAVSYAKASQMPLPEELTEHVYA
jgi:acetoin:2,6-dichlorophenolindophenol oxidoreductase subunit alpha